MQQFLHDITLAREGTAALFREVEKKVPSATGSLLKKALWHTGKELMRPVIIAIALKEIRRIRNSEHRPSGSTLG